MPAPEPIDVPATAAFMQRQFGTDALSAARSTLGYMRATHDEQGTAAWLEIEALLDQGVVA